MAVNSLTNALQPSGITGPPEVMFGHTTLVGDATGGNSTIQFQLDAGFLWMPQAVGFESSVAADVQVALINTEDLLENFVTLSRSLAIGNTFNSDLIILPRMLIRTTRFDGQVRLRTPNVDTNISRFYIRFLRWDKATPPQAYLAFLLAPP